MSRVFFLLLALAVFAVAYTFAILNMAPVELNYLLGVTTFPFALPLLLALVAGWVLGVLTGLQYYLRARREAGRLKRAVRAAETELNNLRKLPVSNVA